MTDRGTLRQWGRFVAQPWWPGAALLLFMGLLPVAGCGGSGGKAGPAGLPSPEPSPASILFVSDRDGHKQIYRMAPDGTGVR